MKYFIAHLLSGDVKKYHFALTRALSDRYGTVPLHERVPPHLTVKVPFEAEEIEIASVERILRSFAKTHHSVPISYAGFGHFGFKTVYLDTGKSRAATALAREALETLRANLPWLPRAPLEGNKLHASVARFLSRRQFRRVWRLLSEMRPRFSASFDNLAILKRVDGTWTVDTIIPFLKELPAHRAPLSLEGMRHEEGVLVP